MADENGKQEVESRVWQPKSKMVAQLLVSLRLAALVGTATAAGVMSLNKETKTVTVAVVGTTPILQTFTAKFQHTPAFVYFVIANATASLYNLLVMLLRPHLKTKAHDTLVYLLDTVMFALVATGAAAAAAMAELGKNGNEHARWNAICDKFGSFCLRGGLALTASFVGALVLMIMNAISVITLNKNACGKP
ncbi:CASP-like protein 1B1 [Canna indica]|uniref:CASP-like protein n=1 Tax=Canna indica TaxID=4628 RepID=A0AAQ3QFF1_9LILI|nr:CASP-like protein 1B1 [Canna indica]